MNRFTSNEYKRFTAKYIITKTNYGTCWLWQNNLDRDGYGSFFLRKLNRRAHRASYWAFIGDIPKDMVVDHTCRNRNCVFPGHLRAVTREQNMSENSNHPMARTTCKIGHPFDKVYIEKGGKRRYCSTCENVKTKNLRKKWREADTLKI